MKKTPLLITVGIVVLSVAGYFTYIKFFSQERILLWDLIPENSVAVYETSTCKECIEATKNSVLGSLIQQTAFYQTGGDSLRNILSLIEFPTDGTLVSMHITKKDEFDFAFYVPTKTKRTREFIVNVLQGWSEDKHNKYSERVFNSINIHQLTSEKYVLTWVFIEDNWIFSFTPYLIEDVIRTYKETDQKNFKENITGVFSLPKIQKDAGNLYIRFDRFAELLNVFTEQNSTFVDQIGNALLLDVKTTSTGVTLNGFSSNKANSIFSIFEQQVPTPLGIQNLISNRAIVVTNFGISDGVKFASDLKAFGKTNSTRKNSTDTLAQLKKSIGLDTDVLYESIENEITVCYFDGKGDVWEKVLLIETSNAKIWLDQINSASEKLSADTVFYEKYSEYEVRELPINGFGEKMFFPIVSGIDQMYYTSIGNTIIIADDIIVLKDFLNDIDQEDTWGRSVSHNQFLETTLLESTISAYINTPKIWNSIATKLHPRWKEFVSENSTIINSINMGAIQFSHLNESFYTNVSWQFTSPLKTQQTSTLTARTTTNFSQSLMNGFFIGKNHVDKSNEVLIQDSLFSIHLISKEGKSLWKKDIASPILGEVHQIDYYKNGKLQYLFATAGTLHLIDRLGNYVESYPKLISVKDITHLSVVDYDHSKNYRYLISDQSGKLWMYDKTGKNLEGWNPRIIGGVLSMSPLHFRVRGKDYLVAIRADGEVHLMNRRGESLPKFPLKTESRPAGDFFVEMGKSTGDTQLVLISDGGYRIRISLEGSIISKETLIRTDVNSRFKMVVEAKRQSYIYTRQEQSKLSIFSQDGKLIIENNFLGNHDATVEYYDFGAGNIFITVTDLIQGISFVYKGDGTLLTKSPVQGAAIGLRYVSSKLKVYYSDENELILQDL